MSVEKISDGLLSWASILEDSTREQAVATASLPWVRPHLALMPDAHWGMGSTVGSVIPTDDVVMPAAVGVDVGCGMGAVRTQLTAEDIVGRDLASLREAIQREVPVSMGKYRAALSDTAQTRAATLEQRAASDGVNPDGYAANWRLQLGTLGSGNHFIEICLDEADRVWVFLHSGSRGVGNKIAVHHVKIAQKLCARWHVDLPHKDLAFLPQGADEFWAYLRDLRWAQAFALDNRSEMVDQVVACLSEWYGDDIAREEQVQCHHNYTVRYCLTCSCSLDSGSRTTAPPQAAAASTAPGSPADCRPGHRSYDELVRYAEEIARGRVPSPADAPLRNQLCLLTDALVRALGRSRPRREFDHPCSCPSDHQSGCVADAARTLVSTLRESHPNAARSVGRTWDSRQDAASGPTDGHAPRDSGSLPPQHPNSHKIVWLTRKGAISAQRGQLGLIPGSMGTRSYVVRGLGNKPSFCSAPHGAGRNFSRRAARDRFTVADLAEAMQGIEWRADIADQLIDEIPGAYKDVDQVMKDAADLVEVEHELRQILNVKGT